jgi:hypothetical protein
MRETFRLMVPLGVPPGRYRVGLQVVHRRFGEHLAEPAVGDRPELRDQAVVVRIGWVEVQ